MENETPPATETLGQINITPNNSPELVATNKSLPWIKILIYLSMVVLIVVGFFFIGKSFITNSTTPVSTQVESVDNLQSTPAADAVEPSINTSPSEISVSEDLQELESIDSTLPEDPSLGESLIIE